ncbi:MAG: trimethylamine methyltransferase family protein, partial [Actinobacteria bacterium]|nr:trimethylamine methyltransferase family protein [Actinomycetota bacterium]
MQDTLKLRLLSTDEVATIREKCLLLLSQMGMRVDHEGVLKLLDQAGAQVDWDTRDVRFPVDLIESAITTVPGDLTVKGAEERHDCRIPHPDGLFYGCTNIQSMLHWDPDEKRFVDNSAERFAKWCQLVEVLDEARICAIQTPMDVPAESAEVHALSIQLQNTAKPLWMHAFSREAVPFMFELMVARMGSIEALRERSLVIINPGTVSPFIIKEMDAEEILQACHHGVPISSDGHVMTGVTSPMTIAGSTLQNCAEVLGHVVICQVIKPGHPIMMTHFNCPADMASGFATLATPSANVQRSAGAQVCKEGFGIPVSACPIMTDTYCTDGRSVTEKALGGLISAMAGTDIAYGMGRLGGATLASPIQLVVDDQLVALVKEYIRGVQVDDEHLAVDEILAAGIGGSVVRSKHTLRHCRDYV